MLFVTKHQDEYENKRLKTLAQNNVASSWRVMMKNGKI